jgi:hypothetical protein
VQRLGLIDVEDEDDDIRSTEKCRRKGLKTFCPAVSYGRVSDGGRGVVVVTVQICSHGFIWLEVMGECLGDEICTDS